ncbi:hypothetical protein GCM10009789_87270 [Kribbella sancticallisti]|uniref:ABC transporter domain-containing protein n=1 Tax=Kribbella sancticallisti TaxID=460087 RepID=A0ABP4QRR2_9ACTN
MTSSTSTPHDPSPTSADTAGLSLVGVSKRFPGVLALDDVTFEARPGEIHALVGENGAGKSTLMAIAAGSLRADSGAVMISDVDLARPSVKAARALGLAIVRQHPALAADLSIAENMLIAQPTPGAARRARAWAEPLLRAAGNDVRIEPTARVETLVPEQRFIVEIAKALAQKPKVLVLDEPTEHLRAANVAGLLARIRSLAADGTAVVYISHRIHEVRAVADRITVLRDGRARGTFDAGDLSEQEIVNLIAGRPLDAIFPAKSDGTESRVTLEVTGLCGAHFDDVDLRVRKGEIVGLAGIEGNGQRAFLRALAGLTPASGSVTVDGAAAPLGSVRDSLRAGVAYVPGDRSQEGIIAGYDVRTNLTMRSRGDHSRYGVLLPRRERDQARCSSAEFKVKAPSLDVAVGTLSGGNQQKVVLSSVLATKPKVILADEPTQGVDVGTRSEIYRHLRRYAEAGTAVVVLSSDSLELSGLCDRVHVFSRGKVAATYEGADLTEPNIARSIVTATTERVSHRTRASRLGQWLAGHTAPLGLVGIGIVLLGLLGTYADPRYLSAVNLGGILALTATLGLVAFGQQLVMLTGGIDLSVAPLMGLVVVLESFYLVDGATATDQAFGWLLLLLTGVAVGTLNWALVDLGGLSPVIATLATYMALQAVSLILRPVPGGFISGQLIDTISTRVGFIPVTFIVAVVLALILEALLLWTRTGVRLRAVGSDPEAARTVGISDKKYRLLAYVGCSVLAALAGIPLMSQIGSGDASAGLTYMLSSIAAVAVGGASIFGGRGSFLGALLGALLLSQVNAVTAFVQLDTAWNWYILGGALLISVAAYSKSRDLAVVT